MSTCCPPSSAYSDCSGSVIIWDARYNLIRHDKTNRRFQTYSTLGVSLRVFFFHFSWCVMIKWSKKMTKTCPPFGTCHLKQKNCPQDLSCSALASPWRPVVARPTVSCRAVAYEAPGERLVLSAMDRVKGRALPESWPNQEVRWVIFGYFWVILDRFLHGFPCVYMIYKCLLYRFLPVISIKHQYIQEVIGVTIFWCF